MKRWISNLIATLTLTGVLATTAISSVSAILATRAVQAAPYAPLTSISSESIQSITTWFAARGISLQTNSTAQLGNASWQGANPDSSETLFAARLLASEWQKYTASTLKNSGLRKIYLVTNLRVDGQYRSGMPEPHLENALYFDVSNTYTTSEDTLYMRRVYHHEFLHLIMHLKTGSYAPNNRAWTACNASDFRYGSGGPAMYADTDLAHKAHPTFAFINGYATSGLDEDMAETYADFMVRPDYLESFATKDSGIACKLKQTKSFIQAI